MRQNGIWSYAYQRPPHSYASIQSEHFTGTMKLRGLSAVDILALMVFWGQIQNVLIQSSVEIAVPYMLIHKEVLPDEVEEADSSGSNETFVIAALESNATAAGLNFDGFRCKEKEEASCRMHF